MKKKTMWLLVASVVALGGGGVVFKRGMDAKKAQQAAAAPKTESLVELAQSDVVKAQTLTLSQGLPLSGALRAVDTAVVKARVAGELQGLTVREGDVVRRGDVIARIDPVEYQFRAKQAQEQADAAKAQIDIAQKNYDNNRALVDQGFISKTALDTSAASLFGAQATHKAAVAALAVAQKSLDDTQVRAPISGQVSVRTAQTGERVAIDGRIVELVDVSQLELEATLSAADALAVRVGQVASLDVEGSGHPVSAKVVRISPVAQSTNRSVSVYLRLDKAQGLKQGMFVQGRLGTQQVRGIAIPVTALRTDKPEPYVQLVVNQLIAHKAVSAGQRGELDNLPMVEVKGLDDGATVVQGSVGPLREGTKVNFTAAAKGAPAPAAPASASAPAAPAAASNAQSR